MTTFYTYPEPTPTMRSGTKLAASTSSSCKDIWDCGASVCRIGAPAFVLAPTRPGPRIVANLLSRRCSPICGRTASCFRRQRCWSESDWPLVRGRERRPLRRSRLGCPTRSEIPSSGCSRSIPSCAAPASPGCGSIGVARTLQHRRTVGSSRICARVGNRPGAG